MAGIPSRCNYCDLTFQSGLIDVGPNTSVSITNVDVSCPRCGKPCQIVDGTYEAVGDLIKRVSGPRGPSKFLSDVSDIATRARSEKLSSDDILRELADVSPEFVKKLNLGRAWPALGLILLLFWLVRSVQFDVKVDFNWLLDQAWHISHGEHPEKHLDTNAPPAFPYEKGHQAPTDPFRNLTIAMGSVPNRKARRGSASRRRRKPLS